MKESDIQDSAMIKASEMGARLSRVNVGAGWTASRENTFRNKSSKPMRVTLGPGDLLLKKPRPFNTGIPKGFPDSAGFQAVAITPEMVGSKVAVFIAPEYKTPGRKPEEHQQKLIDFINKSGGFSWVVRCDQDMEDGLNKIPSALCGVQP